MLKCEPSCCGCAVTEEVMAAVCLWRLVSRDAIVVPTVDGLESRSPRYSPSDAVLRVSDSRSPNLMQFQKSRRVNNTWKYYYGTSKMSKMEQINSRLDKWGEGYLDAKSSKPLRYHTICNIDNYYR